MFKLLGRCAGASFATTLGLGSQDPKPTRGRTLTVERREFKWINRQLQAERECPHRTSPLEDRLRPLDKTIPRFTSCVPSNVTSRIPAPAATAPWCGARGAIIVPCGARAGSDRPNGPRQAGASCLRPSPVARGASWRGFRRRSR